MLRSPVIVECMFFVLVLSTSASNFFTDLLFAYVHIEFLCPLVGLPFYHFMLLFYSCNFFALKSTLSDNNASILAVLC